MALLDKVMGKTQVLIVHRSDTVGLGIVMKEAMLEMPDSADKFPVIIVTELKSDTNGQPGPAMIAGVELNDIVMSVGDPPVNVSNFAEFGDNVRDRQEVVLTILRADQKRQKPDQTLGGTQDGAAAAAGKDDDEEDEAPKFVTLRANYLHARGTRAQLDRNPDPNVRARPVHMDGMYQPTVRNMGGLALLQYEYRVSSVAVANEDCDGNCLFGVSRDCTGVCGGKASCCPATCDANGDGCLLYTSDAADE